MWAGVDGLKINLDARLSHTSLTRILAEYGGKKVLSISMRREKMIRGSRKEVISELGFPMSLAKRYNGVFVHQEDKPAHLDAYYEIW